MAQILQNQDAAYISVAFHRQFLYLCQRLLRDTQGGSEEGKGHAKIR